MGTDIEIAIGTCGEIDSIGSALEHQRLFDFCAVCECLYTTNLLVAVAGYIVASRDATERVGVGYGGVGEGQCVPRAPRSGSSVEIIVSYVQVGVVVCSI